jgi:hypothetical protein
MSSTRITPVAIILAAFACAIALGSAQRTLQKVDVSGTWKWMMQRPNGGGREVTLTLIQDGDKLTGTLSGMGGDTDIEEGSVADGNITFKITRSRGGDDIVTTYTGRLEGDVIKGKAATQMGGQTRPRDWQAERVKDDPAEPATQP